MNEWEFTSLVAGWINAMVQADASLPSWEARCEKQKEGLAPRGDLTFLDENQRVVLTGEVKLPYARDGSTPYNFDLVRDARRKAARQGAEFFFTWNVNKCVLWETEPAREGWLNHDCRSWDVERVAKESDLEQESVQFHIRSWLATFLGEVAQILRRAAPLGYKPPDAKFIEMLESALDVPIQLTTDRLAQLYQQPRFRAKLDGWMRDEQGWTIVDDPEGVRENLDRAAKFACYALVNKLVFHEALLKRHHGRMDSLAIPEHIQTGEELRAHLEGYFARAKEATGDYETVFGEEHASVGSLIPFYSDAAVLSWRGLVENVHRFDFSRLDYDVIGSIFERLIAPEERRKYGQFYTRVEVVDLINSFCIRSGEEKIMDPACGGGTFLVRAYARKRHLQPGRRHRQLLSDLYGVDVSQFATHLTTINLATRELLDDENYPVVGRHDFFDVSAQAPFVSLPHTIKVRGLGKREHRDVVIPRLDAVVGNPPYVRQEQIPRSKAKARNGTPQRSTKDWYRQLVHEEAGAELSGRSDIHCYFWPHARSFLKDDGYLCFLTSSQWLDVEYGFRLQEWLLSNFEMLALFESIDEPWFVGARVATTVTILRRQSDEGARMNNVVRFVQLRRPIGEIFANDGTSVDAFQVADEFRDEILGLTHDTVNDRYRARLVRQSDLWNDGVRLGVLMGKSLPEEDEEDGGGPSRGRYYGGKWGVYLRAPDLWFELLSKYGDRLTPLGELAEVRFGVKTGKDEFFFVRDCSEEFLCEEARLDFRLEFGVSRADVRSGRVRLVRCGEKGSAIFPIESRYLEPEVHSLMEVKGFTVRPEDCSRMILLVGGKRSRLRRTHVLRYIEWGEKQGYHLGATCAARAVGGREWYDLTDHRRGALFWPKSQQYKHVAPQNDAGLQCNCNLYDVDPNEGIGILPLAGLLNSSLTILSKFQYGRPVGVEGNLKTEIIDVKMMLVPDPRAAGRGDLERIEEAFRKMKGRSALQALSERRLRAMAATQRGREHELERFSELCELDMPDRRELDDAVLRMLGMKSKSQREAFLSTLYDYLRGFFESVRQKEEKAIANKNLARRRGAARPADIAAEIFEELRRKEPALLRGYDPDFIPAAQPFDTYDVPQEGAPRRCQDMINSHGLVFVRGDRRPRNVAFIETKHSDQDDLLILLAEAGIRGLVRVPRDGAECRRLLRQYAAHLERRSQRARELVEERTADEDLQADILACLQTLLTGRRVSA